MKHLDSGNDYGGDIEHSKQTPQGEVDILQETSRRELQDYAKNRAGSDTMSYQVVTPQNKSYIIPLGWSLLYT